MQEFLEYLNQLTPYEISATLVILIILAYVIADKLITKKNDQSLDNNVEINVQKIDQPLDNNIESYAQTREEKENNGVLDIPEPNLESCEFKCSTDVLLHIFDNKNALSKEEILKLFKIAQDLSESPKEKVKISVISKKYENSINLSLEEIYGTYFKDLSPLANKVSSDCDFSAKKLTQDEPSSIDVVNESNSVSNDSNYFKEKKVEKPIDLMSQISVVSLNNTPTPNLPQVQLPCNDVWANYMCFENGRMGLKNTFFHLDNEWGSIASIAELQDKISNEIGLDANEQPKEWVMVSVIPFRSSI